MKIYGHSGLGVFGHSGLGVCSDIGGYLDIRGSDVRGSTPNVQKPRTSKNPQCPKPNHSPERPQPRMSLTPNPQPRMSKPRMSTTPNVRQGFFHQVTVLNMAIFYSNFTVIVCFLVIFVIIIIIIIIATFIISINFFSCHTRKTSFLA